MEALPSGQKQGCFFVPSGRCNLLDPNWASGTLRIAPGDRLPGNVAGRLLRPLFLLDAFDFPDARNEF